MTRAGEARARAGALLGRVAPWPIGLAGFLAVAGWRILDVTNIAWLAEEDPATQYLGWAFFRHDGWHLPPGANPRYGLELSNAVLYSDSIPLLAMLFKPFSPLLPEPFQYFGIWILLCFLLQAYFGWRLAGLLTPRAGQRALVAALLLFAPPMLFRLAGHWSLVGHWMLLAALYLTLAPSVRRAAAWWVALTACATLVHTYLLAMVGLLWLASLATRAWTRRLSRVPGIVEGAIVPAAGLLALWAAGFFLVGEGKEDSFGFYRMNATSLVNAMGWSHILPDLGGSRGEYEGFSYLGLGYLLGLVAAVPAAVRLWLRGRARPRLAWLPLAAVLAALAVFALSNEVAVGHWSFSYPLPRTLSRAVSMARASGRMFWPVFYVIVLGIVASIVRGYPARVALAVLCVMLGVQVVDSSAGWMPYRQRLQARESAWATPLQDRFWSAAARIYPKLRVIPPRNKPERWSVFAEHARAHRLATDAVYLARMDRDRYDALARRAEDLLFKGGFDDDALYVLQGVARVVPCLVDPAFDLVTNVDGFWVLAPGWRARGIGGYDSSPLLRCPVLSRDEPLRFGAGGNGSHSLRTGWFRPPEVWGVRSATPTSVLDLHVEAGVSVLECSTRSVLPGRGLDVSVLVDGAASATWHVREALEWQTLPVPGGAAARRRRVRLTLSFSDLDPTAGRATGDTRPGAIGLQEIRVLR